MNMIGLYPHIQILKSNLLIIILVMMNFFGGLRGMVKGIPIHTIAGKYRILTVMDGDNSHVYLAEYVSDGKRVAIKSIAVQPSQY